MPRITVYVPDDLKARMEQAGDDLNWSAITQRAIQEAIVNQTAKRNPTNMTTVIERLRSSKQRFTESREAFGRECGAKWAQATAEYEELRLISSVVTCGSDIGVADFQLLIDPEDQLDDHDWEAFWHDHGGDRPDDAFVAGFAKGAHGVFEEVKGKL